MERKLAAIFSADVKGYSRLMGEDDVGTIRTLTAYREVMTTLIQHHRGRVVDSPGDNLLAEFASVVDAVRSAVEIQHALKEKNAELSPQRQMEFRIGINLGDVVVEGARLYGDGVNIAARVEGLATPGGICLSGIAHDQAKHKLALTYKGQAVKVEQVSQELGVRYVLEGSVQKADDRVRINVQLMDGTTGGHLWAERYDRPFANLFTLQDEFMREVVAVLHGEMQEAELKRVQRVPSEDLTAYEFVLRGLAAFNRVGYENSQAANAQARQFFDKALALDPTYAAAGAFLGATYFYDWFNLWDFTPATLERAATLAQKAVGLDHSLPLPHCL